MFTEEEKNCRKILIVVLDGSKVLGETGGVSPLRYALRQVVKAEDEVVVLVIFNSGDLSQSPVISSCCIGGSSECRNDEPTEKERYIRILREEISQGTEAYMRIFRPFYKECKSIGVKFTVKIVVGSTLDAIVMEERNNSGATSVVLGRGFAMDNRPWITQKRWKLSSQNQDEEVLLYTCKPPGEVSESSRVENTVYPAQKISKFKKKSSSQNEEKPIYCTLPNFEGIYQPSSSSSSIASTSESSRETDSFAKFNNPSENPTQFLKNNLTSSASNDQLGFPVELSWEVISEITNQFSSIIHLDSNEAFQMYSGYLGDRSTAIFVKRYIGIESNYVLKAEKKAALTMYHKNIVGLIGFHQNETAMALVFPYAFRGSLMDRFLNGFWTKELEVSFPGKMNIAIGIAQGLCYMHEQCPRGPIVHGDLRPCNILLGHNLQPQITGFGHAKWLQFEQSSPTSNNSCGHKHPSDPKSLALMKSDILAFGLLLLRLFCNRSAPRDDKSLITWARPLLEQGAYHVLYDESEYDFHGLFVVTSAAARCISARPKSRPCMSKVLSLLKGEISCAKQTFPSTESSPSVALTPLARHRMSIDV
ncbi:hypothetical protein L6452_39338 [Arctium lappa]|uniref:Uncharacterized protein n=1 Tax=Arctium lappa TaxID=4217 RepID=A0ACB8XRD4_ARCLA|nr:hypothetical protein L6452_39338 [Arctium lappa]